MASSLTDFMVDISIGDYAFCNINIQGNISLKDDDFENLDKMAF